jgi:hypothetical protein
MIKLRNQQEPVKSDLERRQMNEKFVEGRGYPQWNKQRKKTQWGEKFVEGRGYPQWNKQRSPRAQWSEKFVEGRGYPQWSEKFVEGRGYPQWNKQRSPRGPWSEKFVEGRGYPQWNKQRRAIRERRVANYQTAGDLLGVLEKQIKVPLVVLRFFNFLRLKEISFGHLNMFYFERFYETRMFIYKCASVAIMDTLGAIEGPLYALDKTNKVKISFYGMHMRNITASHVLYYILFKLRNYFTIQNIIPRLITEFRRNSNLFAYRLIVSGRLNRKERAWYKLEQTAYMGYGQKTLAIDFAMDHIALRFGTVGIKVSFVYNKVRPFFYNISFKYNKEN